MAPTVFIEDLGSSPGCNSGSDSSDHEGDVLESRYHSDSYFNGVEIQGRRAAHQRFKIRRIRIPRVYSWQSSPLMGLMAQDPVHPVSQEDSGIPNNNNNNNNIRRNSLAVSVSNNHYRHINCASAFGCNGNIATEAEENVDQQKYRKYLTLRKHNNLLDITIRTVALVRRNQLLQNRLTALQQETRAFIKSVLSNQENQESESKPDSVTNHDEDSNTEECEDVVMKDPVIPESDNIDLSIQK